MVYGDGARRFDVATDNLDAAVSDSAELTELHYAIAGSVERTTDFAAVQPDGASTDIAASLVEIIEGARSQSLAAVILASDGNDTSGAISTEQLAKIAALGVPVHTIGIGRERIPEDLELVQIVTPDNALPGSTITARAAIRHDREGEARIRVYDGDELLATEAVTLPANATSTIALVDIDLREAGYHHLQFSVDDGGDEPERRNNQRSTLVKVEEQQFRVLYFEGEPRWEYKFLRRAIDPEGDVRLVASRQPEQVLSAGTRVCRAAAGRIPHDARRVVRLRRRHYRQCRSSVVQCATTRADRRIRQRARRHAADAGRPARARQRWLGTIGHRRPAAGGATALWHRFVPS
jgi:hypothetical protein